MSDLAYIDEKIWTYEDVQKLDDGKRYEVINGKLYMLASPNTVHQALSVEITGQIRNYLRGRTCEVFSAPMDVDFEKKTKKSSNFTQPDIFVVCDKRKKGTNQIIGAPDFIIEIVSPGDEGKDRNEKLELYLKNRVREYWIIDPRWRVIEKNVLQGDNYLRNLYKITDKVEVSIFSNFKIDIAKTYKKNEYLLREESAPYNEYRFEMSEKLKDYLFRHFDDNFVIKEQEARILEAILSYKDKWTYGDILEFGVFSRCFELIDGELYYKPD